MNLDNFSRYGAANVARNTLSSIITYTVPANKTLIVTYAEASHGVVGLNLFFRISRDASTLWSGQNNQYVSTIKTNNSMDKFIGGQTLYVKVSHLSGGNLYCYTSIKGILFDNS